MINNYPILKSAHLPAADSEDEQVLQPGEAYGRAALAFVRLMQSRKAPPPA